MQSKISLAAFLAIMVVGLSSCEAIGGVFKAGMYMGVILVVIVVILVLWVMRKMRK
jgi:hypothetical protein